MSCIVSVVVWIAVAWVTYRHHIAQGRHPDDVADRASALGVVVGFITLTVMIALVGM